MKKTLRIIIGMVTIFLVSCATTGNGGAKTGVSTAPVEDNTVFEGDGLSLAEAIEQSAEKIAVDLPAGSRVAFAAWESPNAGLSDYIMEELTGALVDRGMEVADRQNLEYVYRELDFQMSGVVSDESARFIGKFLGADMVITGQLTELGGPYRYRANAINVESATRDSVTRLDVKGDAAMRRMAAALANQKTAVKTSSYGVSEKSAPKTAGAFLDRGILFASRGDYEMAIEDFTEALTLNQNLSAAYLLRGRALFASISYVTSAGENFSSVSTRFTDVAIITAAQRQAYDRAIADFTEAIKLDPNSSIAYQERGDAYYYKGDNDQAIADYNQAIRLSPNVASTYNSRGDTYRAKGDHDRAIADFTQAIRLDPNVASTYNNRGLAYGQKGDHDRAIADYTQAIRLDPNDAAAYVNRGSTYSDKGDYDRAITDHTQAVRLDPNYASTYYARGNAYYHKRDYDRAITDYTQAVRLDSNLAVAYNNRGSAYFEKGDYDRAIADYTQAVRLDPNYALAYYSRGRAYYRGGDFDKAIADYTQAIRLDPNDADARNGLESARRARGR
jgi:tetratricopeptide (TPR) repeat protein